jgi:hypothetical protein
MSRKAETVFYLPKAKLGDLVKLKKPETSYTLPDELKDGDEAIISGEWDHSYYRVTKDGKEFQVSFMCIDLPLVPYAPLQSF